MAQVTQLPCDADGVCMGCKATPAADEKLTCATCVTPWHLSCLVISPSTPASSLQWECPDCTTLVSSAGAAPVNGDGGQNGELVAAIRAIEADTSLTERQKAKRRQELLSGKEASLEQKKGKAKGRDENDLMNIIDENFKCSICIQLPERPVTTPCGHNFCLKCFDKWIKQGKSTCAKCRTDIPHKMASQPRINATLVAAIRVARMSKSNATAGTHKVYHHVHNQYRPDKAYTTDRAKKNGMANAASGRIFVTTPSDHFGPIPAENDPVRNMGVLVGESWDLRMECRQWGIHYPHVSGIAGQSNYGAQSVVLSGGYEDDEDHGEWFLYTGRPHNTESSLLFLNECGSGGRDLSGNKRTNKEQSSDQTFQSSNEALRFSCKKGYPVRVVRSHKEKRSNYAPEEGLRYDGIYRIEKCWRKVGIQGFKVCRYLFVRCDNELAPWTSDDHGDRPRPLPAVKELKQEIDIFERTESPSWDYDEEGDCWKWKKPPPCSRKPVRTSNPEDVQKAKIAIRKAEHTSVKEKLLKEFSCLLCKNVMNLPLTTPCAHNFCKSCLQAKFAGQTLTKERSRGGRTLRSQKNTMTCPACPTDIAEFLQNPQVNRELMDVIEKLQASTEEEDNVSEDIVEASTVDQDEEHEVSNSQTEEMTKENGKRKAGSKPPTRNKKKKVETSDPS